jgi:CHAD domain-containing protein
MAALPHPRPSRVSRYRLTADTEIATFVAGLGQRATLEADRIELLERTVHDTFDWRLHNHGSLVERQHLLDQDTTTVVWRSLDRGEVIARFDRDDVPRFAWDLEPGPVAARLEGLIEMRALLPLATVATRRTVLRLVDDEHKTIARLVVEELVEPQDRGLDPVVSVEPLRGYAAEARALTAILDAQVLLTPGADDLMVAVLRSEGYVPGSYSSKLRTNLDPSGTATEAWVAVLRLLLAALRTNEAGLRDDLDSEFLHDYRVAVRRTRSVLGEASGIFAAERLAHFKTEFKWLGTATSPTRDLDVFLLDTATFADTLPPERRGDLKAFSAYLDQRQRESHRALVADLDTDRYAALIDSWSQFLERPPAPTPAEPDAERPAPDVASERIAKAHRRLVRRGRRIDASSEAERLHDLRKDAKRLRYLLECFGSLFPSDEIRPIVKQLKGVQDVLGTFQDGEVQSSQLETFAQDMLDRGNVGASAVMVIGLLVEQLEHRGHEARAAFADRFATFDTKAVRTAVHHLVDEHHAAPEPATTADRPDDPDLNSPEEPTP